MEPARVATTTICVGWADPMLGNKGVGAKDVAIIILVLIFAIILINVFFIFWFPELKTTYYCPVFCKMRRSAIEGGDTFWDAMFSWDTLKLWKGGPFYSYIKYKADEYDQRDEVQPKEANCWCGVDKAEGKFLHVRIDWDRLYPMVYDYHLTDQSPAEHNQIKVSGNVDHRGPKGVDVPEQWNWTKYDGCLIFSVDESQDQMALYGVRAETIVNNTLKDEIWGYVDDRTKDSGTTILNVSNPGAAKEPLQVDFGTPINVSDDVGEGQYMLLNLSLGLALSNTLKCRNVTGFESYPYWEVI